MIEIPTNDEGVFEAVAVADGTVLGRGTVTGEEGSESVKFLYGPDGPDADDASLSIMPLAEFANTWPQVTQASMLELRAAEGS